MLFWLKHCVQSSMTAQRVVILYQVFARIEVDDEGENYQ